MTWSVSHSLTGDHAVVVCVGSLVYYFVVVNDESIHDFIYGFSFLIQSLLQSSHCPGWPLLYRSFHMLCSERHHSIILHLLPGRSKDRSSLKEMEDDAVMSLCARRLSATQAG